jgi:hypothetical protein
VVLEGRKEEYRVNDAEPDEGRPKLQRVFAPIDANPTLISATASAMKGAGAKAPEQIDP